MPIILAFVTSNEGDFFVFDVLNTKNLAFSTSNAIALMLHSNSYLYTLWYMKEDCHLNVKRNKIFREITYLVNANQRY